jgi:hypothetical protein
MAAKRRAAGGSAGPDAASQALRRIALRHAGTEEGVACAGTALEKRTIRAGKKAFLFLGRGDAMLKVRESLAEAQRFAAKDPAGCRAGGGGWVSVRIGEDGVVPLPVLEKWIAESYRLMAPPARAAAGPSGPRSGKARKR